MGFMDKAKKMAEQAQAKLDETQKQFNAGQQSGQAPPAVEYDQHGRPIAQQEAASPPHGDPLAEQAPPPPTAAPPVPPTAGDRPTGERSGDEREAQGKRDPLEAPAAGDGRASDAPPARPEADAADVDRNHPSYEPPKLSSGDPLAG